MKISEGAQAPQQAQEALNLLVALTRPLVLTHNQQHLVGGDDGEETQEVELLHFMARDGLL